MSHSKMDGMTSVALGMSNFDDSIDPGFEDALRSSPGKVFGLHAAWNFNGKVWFSDGKFFEEVWVYNRIEEILSANSLRELKDLASENFGHD
jgi:hypothetical protein